MVLDAVLFNTQNYKGRIKISRVIQGKELRSRHLGVQDNEKGAFGSPSTTVANLLYWYIYIFIIPDLPYEQDVKQSQFLDRI